jgi:hypothetical protein
MSANSMHHRYGRHGIRAWLHWEMSRLERFTCNSNYQPPSVMLSGEELGEQEERIYGVNVDEQGVSGAKDTLNGNESNETLRFFSEAEKNLRDIIQFYANEAANKKAKHDVENETDILDEYELKSFARQQWEDENYIKIEAIMKAMMGSGIGGEDAAEIYADVFALVYSKHVKEAGRAPLSEQEKRIRKQALEDREWDVQQDIWGKGLEGDLLHTQAAVRVVQLLDLDVRSKRQEIGQYIEKYKKYYRNARTVKQVEEGSDSDNRSGMFPESV